MGSESYFNEIAEDWDSMQKSFFTEEAREFAIRKIQPQKGRVYLDMGAGTGYMTEALLKQEVEVLAVDQSEAMLKKLASKFRHKSLTLIQADANHIPLDGEQVDGVFANMFLHHVEDPQAVLQELYRILKKGGTLMLTDLKEHNHEFLVLEQQDVWMGFGKEDLIKWMGMAGFTEVDILEIGAECCTESACSCEEAKIGILAVYGRK